MISTMWGINVLLYLSVETLIGARKGIFLEAKRGDETRERSLGKREVV